MREKERCTARSLRISNLCDNFILREVSDSWILSTAYIVEEHSVALRGTAGEQ
jgi:hypothetical protein